MRDLWRLEKLFTDVLATCFIFWRMQRANISYSLNRTTAISGFYSSYRNLFYAEDNNTKKTMK